MKKYLALLLVALMIMSFVACGKQADNGEVTPAADTKEAKQLIVIDGVPIVLFNNGTIKAGGAGISGKMLEASLNLNKLKNIEKMVNCGYGDVLLLKKDGTLDCFSTDSGSWIYDSEVLKQKSIKDIVCVGPDRFAYVTDDGNADLYFAESFQELIKTKTHLNALVNANSIINHDGYGTEEYYILATDGTVLYDSLGSDWNEKIQKIVANDVLRVDGTSDSFPDKHLKSMYYVDDSGARSYVGIDNSNNAFQRLEAKPVIEDNQFLFSANHINGWTDVVDIFYDKEYEGGRLFGLQRDGNVLIAELQKVGGTAFDNIGAAGSPFHDWHIRNGYVQIGDTQCNVITGNTSEKDIKQFIQLHNGGYDEDKWAAHVGEVEFAHINSESGEEETENTKIVVIDCVISPNITNSLEIIYNEDKDCAIDHIYCYYQVKEDVSSPDYYEVPRLYYGINYREDLPEGQVWFFCQRFSYSGFDNSMQGVNFKDYKIAINKSGKESIVQGTYDGFSYISDGYTYSNSPNPVIQNGTNSGMAARFCLEGLQ